MLTLTTEASNAVTSIVDRAVDSTTGGLRIAQDGPAAEGFALTVAPAPEAADTVIEAGTARVFLDSGATQALDDKVLDAEVDAEGSLRFALGVQA